MSNSTIPISDERAETVEQRFRRLESVWRSATAHLSSTSKIVNHPAFQEIVQLGNAVVPFMLRDLSERPRLWVWALPAITGTNPVSATDAGDIAAMSAAWLRRGRRHI